MKASLKAKVKKIVITSSIAAIFSGRFDKNDFTEKDFSDEKSSAPYEKSKLLAE
jgi:nucleoside-diphosphate-sugar epimerase